MSQVCEVCKEEQHVDVRCGCQLEEVLKVERALDAVAQRLGEISLEKYKLVGALESLVEFARPFATDGRPNAEWAAAVVLLRELGK